MDTRTGPTEDGSTGGFRRSLIETGPAAAGRGETQMALDQVVGLVVSGLLLGYLTYALLRPERF